LRTENNGGFGLSLKNNSIKPFLIYPQPSSGNIKLESSFEISKISSISIDGKTIDYQIDDNKSVEISNLKSGIFTLKIELSNGDIYWEKISVIAP
jgi:5-methylcytosine-specific restriction endonuclease McrBC regulatory subunit McrC